MSRRKEPTITEFNPPVYLVSADMPGCGSTTLANGIRDHFGASDDVYRVGVGDAVRAMMGIEKEEDFAALMQNLPDPSVYDKQFYTGLPEDQVCVIDGKLATTVGPGYIDTAQRNVVSIDLTSLPLFSAKRILEREDGIRFTDIFTDEARAKKLLARYSMVNSRAERDMSMRQRSGALQPGIEGVSHHRIDTSRTSKEETLGSVLGADYSQFVPEWEIGYLVQAAQDIADSHEALKPTIHKADNVHFGHHREGVE